MSNPIDDVVAELQQFRDDVTPKLDQIKAGLDDQGTWISEIGPVIDDHTATLAEHTESITLLLQEMPRQPSAPPICWYELNADQAKEAWDGLGTWVADILVGRYFASRKELPDCWPLHVGAVEELTWLWTSWRHAYLRSASANGAADWHARWRSTALTGVERAVEREAEALGYVKCTVNNQQPQEPGSHFGEPLTSTDPTIPTAGHVPPLGSAVSATGPKPVVTSADRLLARTELWWPQFLQARDADVAARPPAED